MFSILVLTIVTTMMVVPLFKTFAAVKWGLGGAKLAIFSARSVASLSNQAGSIW